MFAPPHVGWGRFPLRTAAYPLQFPGAHSPTRPRSPCLDVRARRRWAPLPGRLCSLGSGHPLFHSTLLGSLRFAPTRTRIFRSVHWPSAPPLGKARAAPHRPARWPRARASAHAPSESVHRRVAPLFSATRLRRARFRAASPGAATTGRKRPSRLRSRARARIRARNARFFRSANFIAKHKAWSLSPIGYFPTAPRRLTASLDASAYQPSPQCASPKSVFGLLLAD